MAKYKIEDLRDYARAQGWELITQQYQNLDTDLEYKCPQGHTIFTSYRKIRKDYICPVCKEFKNTTVEMDFAIKPIQKTKGVIRTLAFDQSTKVNGYAVFDGKLLIHYGFTEIKGKDVPERCAKVREWIRHMIEAWKPDIVALEDIQLQSNDRVGTEGILTFKILAGLLGVLEVFLYEINQPYEIIHVSTWRNYSNVKGKHRSDRKRSSRLQVQKCYEIDVNDDTSDAILIGRCCVSNQAENNIIHW